MPYKTECLEGIASNDNEADLHTLGEYTLDKQCIPLIVSAVGPPKN